MSTKRSPSRQKALDQLIEEIEKCQDFRQAGKIIYPMVEIVFLTFCGSMCYCHSYNEIEDYGNDKLDWLRKYLPFRNGIPNHDTINRFLSLFAPKEFEKLLINWVNHDLELPDGTVINIDGKRIARSVTVQQQQQKKEEGGKQAILMVNAYVEKLDCCIASIRVADKSWENDAVEDMLTLLDLSGCILTQDAAGCYKDNIDKIISSKADYVIGLKNNQPTLYEETVKLFEYITPDDVHNGKIEKGRGRVESRVCKVLYISELGSECEIFNQKAKEWNSLRTLIKIESTRKENARAKETYEERYYISSLDTSAKKLGCIIRSHWCVENKLHWVLDVVMNEDSGRKRKGNAAANFSQIRKMSLNQIKKINDPKTGVKRRQLKCARSDKYLENALSL